GNPEVNVPAIQTAEVAAARAAIDCWIGRSKERKSAERIVGYGIRIRVPCQSATVIVHGCTLVFAVQREIGAAVAEDSALSKLLAAIAVDDVEGQAGGIDPYPR